jgi:hypothetical protein
MWDELHVHKVIDSGEHSVDYTCGNCSTERSVPFEYDVLQSLFEHHGQGVEGIVTEYVHVAGVPAVVQCTECGHASKVKVEGIISADGRGEFVDVYEGEVADKSLRNLRYDISNLPDGLRKALDSIEVEHLGYLYSG